jgi:hypothetical protein
MALCQMRKIAVSAAAAAAARTAAAAVVTQIVREKTAC